MEENDLLHSRHAEYDVPKLLNQPSESIVVCDVGCGDPIQDPNVILQWLFQDPLATNSKLSTALMPDVLRAFIRGDSKEIPEDLRKLIDHVLIVHVKCHRESLMHCARTSRSVCATQIHVAVDFDSLVSEIGEHTGGIRA